MNATTLEWSLATLAVWRVTHLLWGEDGPGDSVARLRRSSVGNWFGRLLDCFYCLSLWIALPFSTWLASGWLQGFVGWLALSGAACLLERATAPRAALVEEASPSTKSVPI